MALFLLRKFEHIFKMSSKLPFSSDMLLNHFLQILTPFIALQLTKTFHILKPNNSLKMVINHPPPYSICNQCVV